MTNQAGTNGDLTILGASKVVSPLGDTVAEAPRAAKGETAATNKPYLDLRKLTRPAVLDLDWGGDWKKPDTPHFQWGACKPSPSDQARALLASGGMVAVWKAVGAD